MDPMSVVAVASTYIRIITELNSLQHDSPGSSTIRDVLAETEVLNAVMLESIATITELGSMVPKSAEVALLQCQHVGVELNAIVRKASRFKHAASTMNLLKLVIFWELRRGRVEVLLKSFRTSGHLLRQIAADAMTHQLVRRQMIHFEGVLETKLKDIKTTFQQTSEPLAEAADDDIGNDPGFVGADNGNYERPDLASQQTMAFGEGLTRRNIDNFDPFLQRGTICLERTDSLRATWYPIMVVLDTASHYNIVSRAALADLGLHGPFQELERAEAMTLKGQYHLREGITLRWTLDRSRRIYVTSFYVVDGDFGLLIGSPLILESMQHGSVFSFWRTTISKEEMLRTQRETEILDEMALKANPKNPQTAPAPATLITTLATTNPSQITPATTNAGNTVSPTTTQSPSGGPTGSGQST